MTSRIMVAVAAIGMLAACTTGGSAPHHAPPSVPVSHSPIPLATDTVHAHVSAYCERLAAVAAHINAAQSALYTSGAASSVRALQTELASLEAAAPGDVRTALAELASGFAAARRAIAHRNAKTDAELARLQPKLAADAQTVSRYAVTKCSSG